MTTKTKTTELSDDEAFGKDFPDLDKSNRAYGAAFKERMAKRVADLKEKQKKARN